MFEVARYEGERRAVFGAVIALAAGFYGAMFVAIAPTFDGLDLQDVFDRLPRQFVASFGLDAYGTLPGILATELYHFGWVLVLGIYLAYAAASMVAGDVEAGRMDTLLAAPVSRTKIVGEEFLSLLVPILAVNAITPIVIYAAAAVIGESISATNLVALHVLAIPYLLCCAAIGLASSVFLGSESLAQRAAVGILVAAFLIQTIFIGTDLEFVGYLAPMHYYDPTQILVYGNYDLVGAGILLAATVVLVVASQLRFERMDIA